MTKKKWVVVSNVYCPPSRSHTSPTELRLDNLPVSDNTLVLGDFNAHSSTWDELQPEDSRGDVLLGWACEHDLVVMNDGSHTRSNRSSPIQPTPTQPTTQQSTTLPPQSPLPPTQTPSTRTASEGKSAPDVSICGRTWQNKYEWKTTEAIGSSDHLPIAITICDSVQHHECIFRGAPR